MTIVSWTGGGPLVSRASQRRKGAGRDRHCGGSQSARWGEGQAPAHQTDRTGELRGVRGLYVGDASVFPTPPMTLLRDAHVPPTDPWDMG